MLAWFEAVGRWVANPDRLTAISTSVIALFTVVLAIVGYVQARLIRKSIDLARKEFISAQRPKLRVRNVAASHLQTESGIPKLFTAGSRLKCQFDVVNIGGTGAEITSALGMIFQTRSGLPMIHPYKDQPPNVMIPKAALSPGESLTVNFVSEKPVQDGAETIGSGIPQRLRLFVMGWIEYRDEMAIVRRAFFCREFEQRPWQDGRFRRVENEDYEQED